MSEMTLFQIIDAVKSGGRPEYDDLRYAVCALEGLSTFDHQALMALSEAETENKPRILSRSAAWQWEECFNRSKRAMAVPPKVWLGEDFDPDSPAYQQRRRIALKLLDVVAAKASKP